MKSSTRSLLRSLTVRTAVAVAAVAACGAASALPSFTFNPQAAGLNGQTFTADNLLVSDFATVSYTSTGFTESGYLVLTGAQLGGSQTSTTGLGTTYGLYISYTATATNSVSTGGFTAGNFTSLTYTLYGYDGSGTFTATSAPTATVTLGTGTLDGGTNVFSGTSSGSTVTSANASASLTFTENAAESAFFASPSTFYGLAQTSFNNTSQTISSSSTGFTVTNGGGSINFLAAPVPEPETYALMLGGLAAVGFVARRRSNG